MVYRVPSVLVTGGSGYIGLHIVYQLLAKGYRVHATTRNLKSEQAIPLLLLEKQYQGSLFLYEADLLIPGSFDNAMRNVDAIFHVATPVLIGMVGHNPELQLKPTVEGTNNILESCLHFPRIKTIVMTSSCVTARDFGREQSIVTESSFNTMLETKLDPYIRAKTLAERVTWEFNERYRGRFRIITLHPCVVFGPDFEIGNHFNSRGNFGKNYLMDLMNGIDSGLILDPVMAVDVRDVASAHIRSLECDHATGRFLLFAHPIARSEIVTQLQTYFPLTPPSPPPESRSFKSPARYDNTKSITVLGLQYRHLSETIMDTLNQLHSY